MVTRIRNINPIQLGIVYGVLYGLLGVLGGIIFAVINMAAGSVASRGGLPDFGWLSIIIFPILYGAIGFVAGIVGAFFYNLVAGWTGGIEVTLSTPPTATSPTQPYPT